MGEKSYVYSARTTEKGLALLNETKGEKSWDTFINDAVCAHYNLDPEVINRPPSDFLAKQAEARAKREADKKAKEAEKAAKAKEAAKAKQAKEAAKAKQAKEREEAKRRKEAEAAEKAAQAAQAKADAINAPLPGEDPANIDKITPDEVAAGTTQTDRKAGKGKGQAKK